MRGGRGEAREASTGAAALALALLVALFWSTHVATGGTELGAAGDTVLYYYPQYAAAGAALRDGRLPLWNPYQLCGHPWLATLQGGYLYPFHLAYVFLPTWAAMALSSLFHLTLVALSTALLARRLSLSGWAALLAGALFSMHGKLPPQTSVPNMLEAASWLAPGAVAVTSLVDGRRAAGIALLAASLAASLLAGYPQYTLYAGYTWAALLAVFLFSGVQPVRVWLASLACFGLAIALGALVASPQLLASFELSRLSTRSLESARVAMFPYGWPETSIPASLQLLFSGSDTHLPFPFGLIGLLLLPFALLHRRRRLALALFGLLLVVFGIALGPASPLFDLYLLLPGTASFRNPSYRLLLVVGFLFALLAGFGLDELLHRVRTRVGVRAAFALGALVLAAAVLEPLLDDSPRAELPYTGQRYESIYAQQQDVYPLLSGVDSRVLFWNPGVLPKLPPKLGSVFGLQAFDDYEPMSLERQSLYYGYLAFGHSEADERIPFSGRFGFPRSVEAAESMASRRRLLDLAAVRFVVGRSPEEYLDMLHAFAQKSRFERSPQDAASSEPGIVVYTNPRALPRAYVAYRTLPAPPPDELLPRLADPAFDPRVASYVEGAGIRGGGARPARGHPVPIVRSSETEIELRADLAAEGLVVLADSFYPGWSAHVDGEPAEIVPTNLLFRGVVVPAGSHRIELRYEPGWLPASGAAAGVGVLALVFLAARALSASRREPAQPA